MKRVIKIDVMYHNTLVGVLSRFNRVSAFQYSKNWLENGFSINPITLPLRNDIFFAKWEPFGGLFGVFFDSLPDAWGNLIADKFLISKGINPISIDRFDRLTLLGDDSFGALEYLPRSFDNDSKSAIKDFDSLYSEFQSIQGNEDQTTDLDYLFKIAGSSGGSRPKANITIDDEPWILKFPASFDPNNIGIMEYEYNKVAEECGIKVPEYKLIQSKLTNGFFATKRFDRINGKSIHTVSAGGLLEADYTLPCVDYKQLMQLTGFLTNSHKEILQLYRLMCFNVFAHNNDDHVKNFSFICNDNGNWSLAPAYDLTFSNSYNGWHSTSVNGNGENPGIEDLVSIGKQFAISEKTSEDIANEIRETVNSRLSKYMN